MKDRQERVSCGVIVTDGRCLLLGHATGSPRWDIPKGLAEPDEPFAAAASRELQEETGLQAPPEVLCPLGRHAYLRHKDLVLFAWYPAELPVAACLRCTSMIDRPGRVAMPELDRFGLFTLQAALPMLGASLARVLGEVWPRVVPPLPG